MATLVKTQNGLIPFTSADSGFSSERQFQDFIEVNIERVCRDTFIVVMSRTKRAEWRHGSA